MELTVIASLVSAMVGGFVVYRYMKARMNGASMGQSLKAVVSGGGGGGTPK